jgi:hypothetical protein
VQKLGKNHSGWHVVLSTCALFLKSVEGISFFDLHFTWTGSKTGEGDSKHRKFQTSVYKEPE